MQTVITKFLAPTNHRGARIKVTGYALTKTFSYDYSSGEPHKAAFDEWLELVNHGMAVAHPDCLEANDGWFKLVAWAGLPDSLGCAFIIK